MGNPVAVKIHDDCINKGRIKIKDFAFIGFDTDVKRSDESGNEYVDFFYWFVDDENNYIINTSFKIFSDKSLDSLYMDDLKFLNIKMHDGLNIRKFTGKNLEEFQALMLSVPSENCYYCSFIPNKISDNSAILDLISMDSENQYRLEAEVPIGIFMQIQLIKNRMIFQIPINPNIDSETAFNKVNIIDNCTIDYLGCEPLQETILTFFVLKNDKKHIGVASVTPALDNRIILSNRITKEQFLALYPNAEIINMSKLLILDWKDADGNIDKKSCVMLIGNNNVDCYILNGEVEDCILWKPYNLIYNIKEEP